VNPTERSVLGILMLRPPPGDIVVVPPALDQTAAAQELIDVVRAYLK
jgi:hypothetical protein